MNSNKNRFNDKTKKSQGQNWSRTQRWWLSRYLDRILVGKMTRGKTVGSFLVFVLKIRYFC